MAPELTRPALGRRVLGLPRGGGGARASLAGSRAPLLFVALLTINAGGLAFHVLSSRALGPESYGALGSLLVLLVAITVPFGALQVALTGEVARRHEAGQPLHAGALMVRFGLVGTGGALALAASAPLLQTYLHLPSAAPILWLAAYIVPMSLAVVPWACLCGERRFAVLAAAVVAAAAARLGAGALLLTSGAGVAGAAAATLAGEVVLAGALMLGARRSLRTLRPGRLWIERREALSGIGALAGLALLVGLDGLLARHYLSPTEAGQYVAAAMLARSALFVCQAATSVAIPMLASTHPGRSADALRQTLLVAGVLGLTTTAALTAGAGSLLPAIFGPGFGAGPLLLLTLGLASTAAGLIGILVQHDIVQRRAGAAAAWTGVALLPVLAAFLHTGPGLMAAATLGAVVAALGLALASVRRPQQHLAPRPALARAPAPSPGTIDLSVVVPFHNPGSALRANLERLREALDDARVSYEIITVDDGCTDGSGAAIVDIADRRVRRLTLDRNQGKGEALRAGLRAGRGHYLGFIDADGDVDPRLWGPFLALMRTHRPDALVGSKRHPLSESDMTPSRRLCSYGYQRLASTLFRLPVRDTQVGIKLFRRELLLDVLPRTVERGFVFDLELLAVARRMGYRRLMEAPVALRRGELSTIRPSTVAKMLVQTGAVAWRMYVLGSYGGRAVEPLPVPQPHGQPVPVPVPVAATAGLAARPLSGVAA